MSQLRTSSYRFEIATSEKTLEVFGTVMSRTPKGVVLDLWCPEEPRLNQKITTTIEDIPKVVETILHDNLEKCLSFTESKNTKTDAPNWIELGKK